MINLFNKIFRDTIAKAISNKRNARMNPISCIFGCIRSPEIEFEEEDQNSIDPDVLYRDACKVDRKLEELLYNVPGFHHSAYGYPMLDKKTKKRPKPGVVISLRHTAAKEAKTLIQQLYPNFVTDYGVPIYIEEWAN